MIQKTIIGSLEKAYAVAPLRCRGKQHFLVASELDRPCLLFDAEGRQVDTVWERPGGVMSMVQVPGTDGQFLTTHRFYSFNDAADAVISVVTPRSPGNWEIRTLAKLPYVHRIDIVERDGIRYLIACQLKSGQEYDNDWRFPGAVYAAVLPDDLSGFHDMRPLELTPILDQLPRNHGYSCYRESGITHCLISSDAGILSLTPPEHIGGDWKAVLLTPDPASDAALADLDGDGSPELVAIAPFHGDRLRVYHRTDQTDREDRETGVFERCFEYDRALPFLHGFYVGEFCGRPSIIAGNRSGDRELLCFTYDPAGKSYFPALLDQGVGPANVMVCRYQGKDLLISANREIDEIAMYFDE